MSKLVLVDDDAEIAANLAALLESKGHHVSMFHTMDGTVDKIAKLKPELAILDVMFPDNPAAGFDLARALRQNPNTKELPIIMLTGVNQHFPMDFSAKDIDPDWMPVQDFIEKPANIDDLDKKIRAMLGKK